MDAKTKSLLFQNWTETIIPAISLGMKNAGRTQKQINLIIDRISDVNRIEPGRHFGGFFQTDQAVSEAIEKAMQQKFSDFKMDPVRWSFFRSYIGAVEKRLVRKEKQKRTRPNNRAHVANIMRLMGFNAVASHIDSKSSSKIRCLELSGRITEIVDNLKVCNVYTTPQKLTDQLTSWGVVTKANDVNVVLKDFSDEEVLRALISRTSGAKLVSIMAEVVSK